MLSSRTTARSAVTVAAIAAAVVASQSGAIASPRDPTATPPTLTVTAPATITPGVATTVSATLSNDAAGSTELDNQRVDFIISDFAAVTPSDITIAYPVGDGATADVPLTTDPNDPQNLDGYYGPEDGFTVSDTYNATTDFTVTVKEGGDYRGPISISAQLDTVDPSTGTVTSDSPNAEGFAVTQIPKATPYPHVQDVTLSRASTHSLYYAQANTAGGDAPVSVAFGQPGDVRLTSDEYGSGDALPILYRPSTADYYLAGGVANVPGGGLAATDVLSEHYGRPGDVPLDFNLPGTDGAIDALGVYRPSTETFYIQGADEGVRFGRAGDIPLVGNWTGSDQGDSIGVYRPSNHTFYLLDLDTDSVITTSFGRTGDAPVVGDWNGAGTTLIGVHRGNAFYLAASNTAATAASTFTLGQATDVATTSSWSFTPGDLRLLTTQEQGAAARLAHLRRAATAAAAQRAVSHLQ